MAEEQRQQDDERQIAQVCKKLNAHLAKRHQDGAEFSVLVKELVDKAGGEEKIAAMWWGRFQKVLNDPLASDRLVLDTFRHLGTMIQTENRDRRDADDFLNLDAEETRYVVLSVALDLIKSDEEFRTILVEALENAGYTVIPHGDPNVIETEAIPADSTGFDDVDVFDEELEEEEDDVEFIAGSIGTL